MKKSSVTSFFTRTRIRIRMNLTKMLTWIRSSSALEASNGPSMETAEVFVEMILTMTMMKMTKMEKE